jgi:hypothetical protein
VDILQLVFALSGFLIKEQGRKAVNPISSISATIELLENGLEIIRKAFTLPNIKAILDFINNLFLKSIKVAKVVYQKALSLSDIKIFPSEIGYYLGYFVGWLAQEIIIFLATAGGGTLAKGIQGVVKSYTELLKLAGNVTSRATKAMSRAVDISMRSLVDLFRKIREIAGNLPKYLKTLEEIIDDLIKSLKKTDDINPKLIKYVDILKNNTEYLESIEYIKLIRRPLSKFLSIEQEAAINLYTRSYYIRFNKALRGIDNVKLTEDFKAMEKVLNDALDSLPNFLTEEPLLRSATMSDELVDQLFKVGSDFSDKAFMSTTHSEQALNYWMKVNPSDNVVFKIYAKSGKLIEASSDIGDEAEVLFQSAKIFRVQSIKKIKHPILERALRGDKTYEIILKER